MVIISFIITILKQLPSVDADNSSSRRPLRWINQNGSGVVSSSDKLALKQTDVTNDEVRFCLPSLVHAYVCDCISAMVALNSHVSL